MQLTLSGRVAHRKQRAHSLNTVLYKKLDDFGTENGRGVRGHIYVLKKAIYGKDELYVESLQ